MFSRRHPVHACFRLVCLVGILVTNLGLAADAGAAKPDWRTVEILIGEQKLVAASREAEQVLAAAIAAKDEATWTRALIGRLQLHGALDSYETAVRELRSTPWPNGLLERTTVQLFYAHALISYLRAYSWEIEQRETVASKTEQDLKAWTKPRIVKEALSALQEVWRERAALGKQPIRALATYIDPNDYPPGIRDSLRDLVSYLAAGLLADTSLWTPAELNEIDRLSLSQLLGEQPSGRGSAPGQITPDQWTLDQTTLHPLTRVASVLADLEAWHDASRQDDAALEAHLERLRRLGASFTAEDQRRLLIKHLEQRLPRYASSAWWSVGAADLAGLYLAVDDRVTAHARAAAAARQSPDSFGGKRALALQRQIEAPELGLQSMRVDGRRQRSIEIKHKNLSKAYFRAYKLDLARRLTTAADHLLPAGDELQSLLKGEQKPVATWTTDLPATGDFAAHRTYVTPPLDERGLYVIYASAAEDFRESDNQVLATSFIVSDLVIVTRQDDQTNELAATIVDGPSGKPVAGAEVGLLRLEYRKRPQPTDRQRTDAQGRTVLKAKASDYNSYLVYAKTATDLVLDTQALYLQSYAPDDAARSVFVYTDRSIYRPGQSLQWKVVAYRGSYAKADFRVDQGASLTVKLLDANGETVSQQVVKANEFGSAAGRFVLPESGRLLGRWSIQVAPSGRSWPVQVEEYKRPTFAVSIEAPPTSLRLNDAATVNGEARYYFGQAISGGKVSWRVTREPVYAWWCWWRAPTRGGAAQPIAVGTATVDEKGRFRIEFEPSAPRQPEAPGITYNFRVHAELTDDGGETRSADRSFRLGYVAVETDLDNDRGFYRDGDAPTLGALRHDLDGTPRAGDGQYRLVDLRQPEQTLTPAEQPIPPEQLPSGVRTAGDALRPRWTADFDAKQAIALWPDGDEVAHGELTHAADGRATIKLPPLTAGAYRLRYTTKDERGATYETWRDFVVAPHSGAKAAGKQTSPLAVPAFFAVQQADVAVGDTLVAWAHSGFARQALLLETHRAGKLIERRVIEGGELIQRKITEADRGGFVMTVTAVHDHQLVRIAQTVRVPWDNRELTVDFSRFRDTLAPGAKESWRITVRRKLAKAKGDLSSLRAATELLAYMYDKSLDALAPHRTDDPLAILPNRAVAGAARASLTSARGQSFGRYYWRGLPSPPTLRGDQLIQLTGGMLPFGGGGYYALKRSRRDGAVAMTMPTMGLPAPAAPAGDAAQLQAQRFEDAAEPEAKSAESAAQPPPAGAAPPNAPPPTEQPLRSDFSETAFFLPHLLLEKDGGATIEFQVPDSVTAWTVWAHAIGKDLSYGSATREVKTLKELMVRPYLPRFLREGDAATLRVVVNNAGKNELAGELTLDIVDPDSGESLLSAFGAKTARQPFSAKAGGSATLSLAVKAPARLGLVKIIAKATATGDGGTTLGDGESRPLPLLPSRLHLVQSRFTTLKGKQSKQLRFDDLAKDDDPSRLDEQLVVAVDAQLFLGVLRSLPYLVSYPYECAEQIYNRFFAAGLASSIYETFPAVAKAAASLADRRSQLAPWDTQDPNRRLAIEETPWVFEAGGGSNDADTPLINLLDKSRAKRERDTALDRLRKLQTADGGFPWFAGGRPSPYISLYLALGFARAVELKVPVPKDMVVRTWRYLGQYFAEELRPGMARERENLPTLALLAHALSSYPDVSWTGGVIAQKERDQILDYLFKYWRDLSPFPKSYLALALKRAGRDADAKLVFDAVLDRVQSDEERGSYFAPEERSWLWYNDSVETAAFTLRAIGELAPGDPKEAGFVQWLFLNKQLSHWKSTKATAEAIYALVRYLSRERALGIAEEATVTVGSHRETFRFEPDRFAGKARLRIDGAELKPKADAVVSVAQATPGMMFASATWHFSTERLPERGDSDFFAVERRYFRRVAGDAGFRLEPLAEGAEVHIGDEVEVQLSLRSKHAAEYVHLRDPRGAGFEPSAAVSRWQWDLGIAWYEEIRDSGANFFFEWLPAGEYTFKYRMRAATAGAFRVGPATVQSMYAPEFAAYSAGARLDIAD